jgi:hypothetical protein
MKVRKPEAMCKDCPMRAMPDMPAKPKLKERMVMKPMTAPKPPMMGMK